MSAQRGEKLAALLNSWPPGAVYCVSALRERGYDYSLIHHYRQAGLLAAIGPGALARPGDKIELSGGVYALQTQMGLKVHIAGIAALALRGSLPDGLRRNHSTHLYGKVDQKLPAWFLKHNWGTPIRYFASKLFENDFETGIEEYNAEAFFIKISAPERAILELLNLVPIEETFEQARLLLSGLTTLRPQLVHKLLLICNCTKARKLFMALSEELSLPWVKKADFASIGIGKAKHYLFKRGRVHKRYKITLPAKCFRKTCANEKLY